MKPAHVFEGEFGRTVGSLVFSPDGRQLLTCRNDESIDMYDVEEAKLSSHLLSKKYGVNLIQYTHNIQYAIHASTKVDHSIRHLNLWDNKYQRYFRGHTDVVVSLCMSPSNELFLSGSLDDTIRLWDLREPQYKGLMKCNGRPVAAFDPAGVVFAAGINSNSIKMYDLRYVEKGPFSTFELPKFPCVYWKQLQFSPNGMFICITKSDGSILVVDAFKGNELINFNLSTNSSTSSSSIISSSPKSSTSSPNPSKSPSIISAAPSSLSNYTNESSSSSTKSLHSNQTKNSSENEAMSETCSFYTSSSFKPSSNSFNNEFQPIILNPKLNRNINNNNNSHLMNLRQFENYHNGVIMENGLNAFFDTSFADSTDYILSHSHHSSLKSNDVDIISRQTCITPDSQYVITASMEQSKLHVFNIPKRKLVAILDSEHYGNISHIQFNPKYAMMSSSAVDIHFWLSDHSSEEEIIKEENSQLANNESEGDASSIVDDISEKSSMIIE
ncbi:hypothetical protein SNEBB_003819 [Seison nebaliae]|nr:hypothetical protein SNEBB_003819 [Seison nebaliae]